jgi:hypothetical protein
VFNSLSTGTTLAFFEKTTGSWKFEHDEQLYSLVSNFLKTLKKFVCNLVFSESFICYLLLAGFLLGLFFNPEDGGDMLHRNVILTLTDYMALYLRRQQLFINTVLIPEIIKISKLIQYV